MTGASLIDLPMMLREGTVINMNGRSGRIAHNRVMECLILWDEYTDEETGEVHPRISALLSFFELGSALERNKLHIKSRPTHTPTGEEVVKEIYQRKRSATDIDRAFYRFAYVQAAQELIDEKKMGRTRVEYESSIDMINGRGDAKQARRAKELLGKTKSGFSYSIRSAPDSGTSVYRWVKKFEKCGIVSLFDKQGESGNSSARYSIEELDLARSVINTRLNQERASISNVLESVQATFREENRHRSTLPVPTAPLRVPGYDKVWDLIAQIAPVDHAIRTRGMDVAYKDLHVLGLGFQTTRALERVELDVYECDLMVFLSAIGILDYLSAAERSRFGLDGKPKRLRISAAIDVFTGCIVGLQISMNDNSDLAIRTVEQIYLDKKIFADSVGALSPWNMRGHPETIAVDRGNAYISDDFYFRLAASGITNLGVPAGKPFLKPWIESWFRTVGAGFIQRFTGRTFPDIVKKGENDPQARATLTLDEFLVWITRWIVDVYHNTKPRTLGKKAPLLAWKDAICEAPPYALVDEDQLRVAFGVAKQCKLTRQGFRVGNLHYWSEELISFFLTSQWMKDNKFTVYWWRPRIGAITVELPDGRTVQAQCTDSQWHDKSYDDLRKYILEAAHVDESGLEAKDKAIVAIDNFSNKKATLAGLMPLQPDAAGLRYFEQKFARHVDIPNRKLLGMTEIFGDEIMPDGIIPVPQRPSDELADLKTITPAEIKKVAKTPKRPDVKDIME